jgi:peroxiredoxin Q/BCP
MHIDLSHHGLHVAGISPQSRESHQRFSVQHKLSFPLLVDSDKQVIKSYGVNGPLGIGVRRVSFLIDQQQIITTSVQADFRINRHIDWLKDLLDKRR